MSCERETVIIDDDDDDVEFVEIQNNDEERPRPAVKRVFTTQRQGMPAVVNGYTKPYYSLPQLITQVLAVNPGRRATAHHICDLIATKQPYFKFCPSDWRGSVHMALSRRKKFFVVVGTTDTGERIWSFNPSFEKYMLDKWVPKYIKKRSLETQLAEPLSPVIVSTTSLSQKSNVDNLPSVDSGPEFALADPDLLPECENNTQDHNPWEPEVTVSENATESKPSVPVSTTEEATVLISSKIQEVDASAVTVEPDSSVLPINSTTNPNRLLTQLLAGDKSGQSLPWNRPLENSVSKNQEPVHRKPCNIEKPVIPIEAVKEKKEELNDFTLENLGSKHTIPNDEITYRLSFHKEHPLVEKFRLHCTVCDIHLGTSAMLTRSNVRLHPLLGVLLCTFCYVNIKNSKKYVKFQCCWCTKESPLFFHCNVCQQTFCKACLVRNFGVQWYEQRLNNKYDNWGCLMCDTRPIWPHRAIGYFLYRHYVQLKRSKAILTQKMRISRADIDFSFYMRDLSKCCKNESGKQKRVNTTQQSTADSSVALNSGSMSDLPTTALSSSVPNSHMVLPNPVFGSQTDALPPTTSQQMVVFEKQPSNNIYVQTTVGVPALTLNTGTQYIHNVYPERNYVVVQSPTATSTNTTSVHTSIPIVPGTPEMPVPTSVSVRPAVPETVISPSISGLVPVLPKNSMNTPVSAVVSSVPYVEPLQTPLAIPSTLPTPFVAKSAAPNSNLIQPNITPNFQPNQNIDGLAAKLVREDMMTTPDNQPFVNSVQRSTTHAKTILAVKERIERRPMPKSKKQSLLRAVLMNESIESMKRHLKSVESQAGTVNSLAVTMPPSREIEVRTSNESNTVSATQMDGRNEQQHFEEPILKSIIETATERLLNLQKKQNIHNLNINSNGNNISTVVEGSFISPLMNSGIEEIVDLSDDNPSPIIKNGVDSNISKNHVPKIKIRTLKELQELRSVDDTDKNITKEVNESNNKSRDEEPKSVNTQEVNYDNSQKEVNVTSLKQGIIDASRTLVNTQKKFKELAKVISSNLSYQTEQAVDLITIFQDILKCCRKQIDVIDVNIKNQFGHLLPCTDVNAIFDSIKKGSEDNGTETSTTNTKRKHSTFIFHKKKTPTKIYSNCDPPEIVTSPGITEADFNNPPSWQGTVCNETDVSGLETGTGTVRERDLLDFNPLGKKVILGTPEVTEEDLEQIPNTWDVPTSSPMSPQRNKPLTKQLVRKQNIVKQSYKKRDIWSAGKRRRKYKKYNKDGSLRKAVGRPRSVMWNDTPEITSPHPYKRNIDERLRKRNIHCAPQRMSERRHPSSVEYFARLFGSPANETKEDSPFPFSGYYTIKPCSVIVHRLDPRIVHLLEKRVKEL